MIFPEMHGMHARTDDQRIDIRVQRIEKIGADTLGLHFVEPVAVDQIPAGGGKDPDLHETLFLIFLLAASQSSNLSSPRFCIASLSARTSSCQAGDDITPALLHKSSQSDSIACSFSSIDIFSKG